MERYTSKRKGIRGTGDPKTRERVQRMRERRKQGGWTQHELWLDPATAALIAQLTQPGENVTGVVQRAVQALAQQTAAPSEAREDVASIGLLYKEDITSNDSVDRAFLEVHKRAVIRVVHEMTPQGATLQDIAVALNENGILPLSGQGTWDEDALRKLVAQEPVEHIPSEAIESITSNGTSNDTMDRMNPLHRKAALIARLQEMKAEGLSLQTIANRLNTEGVATLSGKGTWKKGTIGNLLAEVQDMGAHDA